MSLPANQPSPVPKEIPESFFQDLADPVGVGRGGGNNSPTGPIKALMLYDLIIDKILLDPEKINIGTVARELRKSPATISMIMRSDFFKARWLQRRESYNEELNFRLTAKMSKVAEKSLDVTLHKLETQNNIPLPVLDQINKTLLDRLGYAPSSNGGGPTVLVQQNNNPGAAQTNAQASPEGLSRAQEFIKILEQRNAASGARPGNAASADSSAARSGLVVEGESHRVES